MTSAVLVETRLDVMERQLLLLLEDLQDLRALTEALADDVPAAPPPALLAGAA